MKLVQYNENLFSNVDTDGLSIIINLKGKISEFNSNFLKLLTSTTSVNNGVVIWESFD